MNQVFEAVYEKGVLRLLQPTPLREQQHVLVTIAEAPPLIESSEERPCAVFSRRRVSPRLASARRKCRSKSYPPGNRTSP